MERMTRLLAVVGLAALFVTCASADISWTFSGVTFTNGDSVTGSFTTDSAVTGVDSFSVAMSGPDAFSVDGFVDSYLPGTVGFYATGWSNYVDLYLASPLTGAGGTVDIASGYDCPSGYGCGVLNAGAEITTHPSGSGESTTPEPGFYGVLTLGLSGLALAGWRRRRA